MKEIIKRIIQSWRDFVKRGSYTVFTTTDKQYLSPEAFKELWNENLEDMKMK